MKICTKCGQAKPIDQFGKRKQTHDGLYARCRPCNLADRQARYETERKSQNDKYHASREQNIQKQRDYRKKNPEVQRRASLKWAANNSLYYLTMKKIWEAANPDKNAASATRYYTRKRLRCPNWLTPEQHAQIEKFYSTARWLSENSGVLHAVDHIVPLHGKNVCGLHVPWNLQVLTRRENSQKGNKYE